MQLQLARDLPLLTPDNPLRRGLDRNLQPSDEIRWPEWSNRAKFDAGRQGTGYLSVARDRTDQRLSAGAAEQGRYVRLNPKAAQVTGRPHDQIIGRFARQVPAAAGRPMTCRR